MPPKGTLVSPCMVISGPSKNNKEILITIGNILKIIDVEKDYRLLNMC